MGRYYLDLIGRVPHTKGTKKDKRQKRWKAERKFFGFDERETWNLGDTLLEMIYERLVRYLEVSNVDLTYHTYKIKKETLNLEELINRMISNIRRIWKLEEELETFSSKEEHDKLSEERFKLRKETYKILAIVTDQLWW